MSDPALEATACDLGQIDAQLASKPPHGRPRVGSREPRLIDWRQIQATRHLGGTCAVPRRLARTGRRWPDPAAR